MPGKHARTVKVSPAALTLPEGMEDVGFSVRLPEKALRFPQLTKALEPFSTFLVNTVDQRLSGVLSCDESHRESHGHLFIGHEKEEPFFQFRFELAPGEEEVDDRPAPTLGWFLKQLHSFVEHPAKQHVGVLTSSFRLDSRRWEPTVPLPFNPPAALEQVPGLPQIAGVDFSFPDPSPAQPYIRVFVSTYPPVHELVVRMMLGSRLELGPALGKQMVQTVEEHVRVFVRSFTENADAS